MSLFNTGDRYIYKSTNGTFVQWIRRDDGVWVADDGREALSEVNDNWMRRHIIDRFEKANGDNGLPWAFVSVGIDK